MTFNDIKSVHVSLIVSEQAITQDCQFWDAPLLHHISHMLGFWVYAALYYTVFV